MRIRHIKPEFFRHEDLSQLPAKTRLLFIGLWCLADCEGRIEDRVKRIRVEVFPYDTAEIDEDLDALAAGGFITRYAAQSLYVIEVTAFRKHQRLTGKEASYASQLPPRGDPGDTGEASGKHPGRTREIPDAQVMEKGEGRREKEKTTKGAKTRRAPFSEDEFDALLSPAMRNDPRFVDAWHRWNTVRHGRGKRISEAAAKEQIRTIHAMGIPAGIASILKSIASDWTGIFPEKAAGPGAPPAQRVLTFEEATAHIPRPVFGPLRGINDKPES